MCGFIPGASPSRSAMHLGTRSCTCLEVSFAIHCTGMIFWSRPSCLPIFTIELLALDRISVLEVKLESVDSLISEFQVLKLEIFSLRKYEYTYLRAAFRIRTDSTTINRNSMKRKVVGNETLLTRSLKAETSFPQKQVFHRGLSITNQTIIEKCY